MLLFDGHLMVVAGHGVLMHNYVSTNVMITLFHSLILFRVELFKRQSEESLSSAELVLASAEAQLISSTPLDGVDDDVESTEPSEGDDGS